MNQAARRSSIRLLVRLGAVGNAPTRTRDRELTQGAGDERQPPSIEDIMATVSPGDDLMWAVGRPDERGFARVHAFASQADVRQHYATALGALDVVDSVAYTDIAGP